MGVSHQWKAAPIWPSPLPKPARTRHVQWDICVPVSGKRHTKMSIYKAASSTRCPRECFNIIASSGCLQGCKRIYFHPRKQAQKGRVLPVSTQPRHSTNFPGLTVTRNASTQHLLYAWAGFQPFPQTNERRNSLRSQAVYGSALGSHRPALCFSNCWTCKLPSDTPVLLPEAGRVLEDLVQT